MVSPLSPFPGFSIVPWTLGACGHFPEPEAGREAPSWPPASLQADIAATE